MLARRIGRALGLVSAIAILAGGTGIATAAAQFAGLFNAPTWALLLIWGASGLIGIMLGAVGVALAFRWIDTQHGRRRRAKGPAH